MRGLAGIKEDILDWVPEERARYTRLGAIILNTGCLAALALLAALDRFLEVPWVLLLPVALFWGWVIISIDGWLVASTHGMLSAARFGVFIPRLVLALLIGLAIAEPLMLKVFQPAIHQEVRDQRDRNLNDYEDLLVACNPVTGEPANPRRCADEGARLAIQGSPDSVQGQLEKATTQRDNVKQRVDQITDELAAKQDLARRECNGQQGAGLSGVVGEGPNCERNRLEADRFRADSGLQAHQAQLQSLDQEVERLTGELRTSSQDYEANVSRQIAAEVEERRSNQREIGILDEHDALGRLSAQSAFVLAAQWVLRLLLLAIDSLPVLTKLMSGTTTYDRLLNRQLATDEYLHDMEDQLRRRHDTEDKEVQIRRIEHNVRSRLEAIAETDRARGVQRDAEIDAEIDKLAERLRRWDADPLPVGNEHLDDGWRHPAHS